MARQNQTPVEICNLVSQGMSLKEAREIFEKKNQKKEFKKPEGKKLSAAEKKEILKVEIEALNGEVPADGSSVAVFEQALQAAKELSDSTDSEPEFM